MKLLKTVTFMFMVCGVVFAQGKVSPVVSMTWDIDSTATVTQRIGVQASLGGDRFYGIDTNGSDHRTYLGWKFAKMGIGITSGEDADTFYTLGATYNAIGGLKTEIEYWTVAAAGNTGGAIRISLVATF
jgi:hypothetical protein